MWRFLVSLSVFPPVKWCVEKYFDNAIWKYADKMNHTESLPVLLCKAHWTTKSFQHTTCRAGAGWTGPSMSCGRGFPALLRITCHRYNIPERPLVFEELSMDGGTAGIWVLLCVWEHPLQVGVLECVWMAWESAVPVLWGAEQSWLTAGHLSSF